MQPNVSTNRFYKDVLAVQAKILTRKFADGPPTAHRSKRTTLPDFSIFLKKVLFISKSFVR